MTETTDRWTTLDLELFRDEQLDAQRAPKLSADLRTDAGLRKRLARVCSLDNAVRASLLQPRDVTSRAYLWRRGLVPISCLVVFALAVTWVTMKPTAHPPVGSQEMALASKPRSVRVIFSLPVTSASRTKGRQRTAQLAGVAIDKESFTARLDAALVRGQLDEASELLLSAPIELRHAGYRRIGELLQSAEVAESILDQLSPDEQLAVCGEWARIPSMRPTVFTRLRTLAKDETLASAVQRLLTEMSADPAISVWLKGYQLFHNS